jgi:cytosine/adenosine deaminase-related metal-dependent hydrolase
VSAAAADAPTTILAAAYVAPMDGRLLADAGVAFSAGRILQVGAAKHLLAHYSDAITVDAGQSIILPGLINPHSHLELSHCALSERASSSFTDWILAMSRQPKGEGIAEGIRQCLRFGVTTVGDISQNVTMTRPALRASPLRAVSYGEVLGLGARRFRFDELLPAAIDRTYESERLRIGLTPHAPYTVDLSAYRHCLEIARRERMPLATHLAETPDEQEFLENQSGEFRRLYEMLGSWAEPVETFRGGGPIEFARAIGLLDYPTLLAHVNYCDDRELEILTRGRASVVYCPRTHEYFGHPPHRWREMLRRGINVALGTDSCASSSNLNVVDDLRLVRRLAPDMPAEQLWRMITIRAAQALMLDGEVGSLAPEKCADFSIFPARGDDPLADILDGGMLPSSIWIDGQAIS